MDVCSIKVSRPGCGPPSEVNVDETPRPGKFQQFTYRDELILDITDLLAALSALGDIVDAEALDGLSTMQLEHEYRRVCRHLSSRMSRKVRQRLAEPLAVRPVSEPFLPHHSPVTGQHIGERAG